MCLSAHSKTRRALGRCAGFCCRQSSMMPVSCAGTCTRRARAIRLVDDLPCIARIAWRRGAIQQPSGEHKGSMHGRLQGCLRAPPHPLGGTGARAQAPGQSQSPTAPRPGCTHPPSLCICARADASALSGKSRGCSPCCRAYGAWVSSNEALNSLCAALTYSARRTAWAA